jgi:hypothetical protein
VAEAAEPPVRPILVNQRDDSGPGRTSKVAPEFERITVAFVPGTPADRSGDLTAAYGANK